MIQNMRTSSPQRPRTSHRAWAAFAVTLAAAPALCLAQTGPAASGSLGGLVIPGATVLDTGDFAFSVTDYQEPQLGVYRKRRSYGLGIGLLPRFEVFGRFADYQNPVGDSRYITGPRDLSLNAKYQLPSFWSWQPNVALGVNDVGGGSSYFTAGYVVAGDSIGPLRWTLGYAKGRPIQGVAGGAKTFDGAFGGVEFKLGQTGLALLAEHDGQQRHAGVRYYAPPIAPLAGAHLVASVHRSFGARDGAGRDVDGTSAGVSLVVPFEKQAAQAATLKPRNELPPLDEPHTAAPRLVATGEDRQEALLKALQAAGLESVRVGLLGPNVLVEYENHRYGQNEADAIGIVLGLAAEFAPQGTQRVYAVTYKSGLRMYQTSVGVAEYRRFLRNGEASYVRTSLALDRLPDYRADDVKWIKAVPSRRSLVRVEVQPSINYTLGTEYGALDYSLAADVQALVPLWRGAEIFTSHIKPLAESDNFEPGGLFASSRHRDGLRVASLQQSFWVGPHIFANVGVGRFNFDNLGVQGEASVFVPGRDDVIRFRGAAYQRAAGQARRPGTPLSASYRYVHSQTTWLEAGLQQFSDSTWGTTLDFTRWFGDVGAHLVYRRGGEKHFAGIIISIPLTPRRGMAPGPVTVAGTSRFMTGVRTRLTIGTSTNTVDANAARSFLPDYNAEVRQLNSGRSSEKYFQAQLYRMREAFYLYGRDQVENSY